MLFGQAFHDFIQQLDHHHQRRGGGVTVGLVHSGVSVSRFFLKVTFLLLVMSDGSLHLVPGDGCQ